MSHPPAAGCSMKRRWSEAESETDESAQKECVDVGALGPCTVPGETWEAVTRQRERKERGGAKGENGDDEFPRGQGTARQVLESASAWR
jgi:hypothetical protein